jgi:hypothetical protein
LASLTSKTGTAREILQGWAGSFRAYRERNDALINADDSAFGQYLDEEETAVVALLAAASQQKGPLAESWRAAFEEDLRILKMLR